MIKLYKAQITDFNEADYAKMYSLLDYALKQKVDFKKCKTNKKQTLAGYILLWQGAKEVYGESDFKISFNQYGKPICDFCEFNISHSKQWVVCAFSDKPIGVDIQKISHIKPRQRYKFFNQKENIYVNQNYDFLSEKYIEIFTKKEAALKMLGLPIFNAAKIDTFSDEFCFKVKKFDEYILCICTSNA